MRDAAIAYYPLKEDGDDYTTSGRNATLIGGVQWAPGPYGSAARFTASGAAVLLPTDAFPRYLNDYTVAAWVNRSGRGPVSGESSDEGVIAGRLTITFDTGVMRFTFFYDSAGSPNNQQITVDGSVPIDTDVWTAVAVTYAHATKTLTMYVNGRLDSAHVLDIGDRDRPQCPTPFGIGGNPPASDDPATFNGSIGDVCFFDACLDRCCLHCLAGYMNYAVDPTGPEHTQKREAAFFIPVIILVAVAIAGVGIEQILVDKIEAQPKAPPSPKEKKLEDIAKIIGDRAGRPADAAVKVTRANCGIPMSQVIRVDVGGMGVYRHNIGNTLSGLPDMLNINDKTTNPDSFPNANIPIPNLIYVKPWKATSTYPLGDQFADYVVMQSAPLTDTNVAEMARILRHGGTIGLWIDQDAFDKQIKALAKLLKTEPLACTAANGNLAMDEFEGTYGLPKVLLTDRRR